MDDILLSIWCITYNHELYIRDAIEGFLSQRTNFKYEIIIHDDASTDRTADIIREYEQKYPNLIRGIYQTENQFACNQPSVEWLWEIQAHNCNGKYIASCEGDDYWIDMKKLQVQVNYLETHPKCIMTVHDAVNVDCQNWKMYSGSIYEEDCIVSEKDIIEQKKYLFTASMVYRREVLGMNGFYLKVGIGDYPILLYSIINGYVYYFSRIMSIYRQNHEGSWSNSFLHEENTRFTHSIRMINFLKNYNVYTGRKYEDYIISRIQRSAIDVINLCAKESLENFSKECMEHMKKMEATYEWVSKPLQKLWLQLFDDKYIDENIKCFVNKYQRTVIMGAGVYAGILERQMSNHNIFLMDLLFLMDKN